MKRTMHGVAGTIAMATIVVFFLSTVVVEGFGSAEQIASVKRFIAWGLFLLVPALMATGISGNMLGRSRSAPLLAAKRRRMPLIAANGVMVLVPSALYLNHLAGQGMFGTVFYVVQGVELLAGAFNITLIALNARDGLRLRSLGAVDVQVGNA